MPRITVARRPRLLILGAALLFSTGGAAIKVTSLGGWQVACLRSGIAALALALLIPGWRRRWQARTLAVGTAYAATMILFVIANKLTTAANAIFLQGTAPLYLLLLGPWLLGERTRRTDLVFTVLLLGGMVLFFVAAEPARTTAPAPGRGNWLALSSGLSWALTLAGFRWLGRRGAVDPWNEMGKAVVAGNLIACAASLPLALPVRGGGPVDWMVVVYLGVFQIGLAYLLLTRGVRHVPALETSLLLLLEPVLNALWAWLLLAERPASWSLAGGAIVFGTTVALTLRRRA